MSTDKDEQFTSYEAQVEYYTDYIRRNPDWDFVKVYTDEGITGTSTKKREGFNEMVNDALAGKIDLIVTKSVSRFARNTVDSLVTIRDLKAHGVEVFFEKENIYTFDGKGELLLTIMSSIAQEESRSISENVTWGHRKRFADGKIIMSYKTFLGYDKGEDGMPVINPKEAEIVRSIYRMFMKGKTPFAIAKALEKKKVPTPMGKPRWSDSTIISILTNEKYKGDALLQKTFTVDFLTKKKKANEGEVPQYYVKGSHPAIIDSREWEAVQSELAYRKSMGKAYSGTSIFSSRLVCGDCGELFGSKVWHSTDVYRKEIWRCNRKFDRDHICNTPHLTAQQIQTIFLRAYNELMQDALCRTHHAHDAGIRHHGRNPGTAAATCGNGRADRAGACVERPRSAGYHDGIPRCVYAGNSIRRVGSGASRSRIADHIERHSLAGAADGRAVSVV